MEETTNSYIKFTHLLLESLQEEDRELILKRIVEKTNNFCKMSEFSIDKLLSSRQMLLSFGKERRCEEDVKLALTKIPYNKNGFKSYLITFAELFVDYNEWKRKKNQTKAKFEKISNNVENLKFGRNDDSKLSTTDSEESSDFRNETENKNLFNNRKRKRSFERTREKTQKNENDDLLNTFVHFYIF
ncbi:hypothetical protein MHBO_002636 [Bonamia ostreae]|uniref:Uncharacterized protein n=1 Tax=Bonamia ostreae TaxID=126728 RepID=A0ABV2AN05_9EUKA